MFSSPTLIRMVALAAATWYWHSINQKSSKDVLETAKLFAEYISIGTV